MTLEKKEENRANVASFMHKSLFAPESHYLFRPLTADVLWYVPEDRT